MIVHSPILCSNGPGRLMFNCPGCEDVHVVSVGLPAAPDGWGFNWNYEAPTLTPSVLVTSGHYGRNPPTPGGCYCDYEQRFGEPSDFSCGICHSFVTDGVMNFLTDCTHHLAGQSAPLLPLPDWAVEEAARDDR
jgi:hypothetical protein